mgnify:CR=1 FL=1
MITKTNIFVFVMKIIVENTTILVISNNKGETFWIGGVDFRLIKREREKEREKNSRYV